MATPLILLWGTVGFMVALIVHVFIWRILKPKNQSLWLIAIFFFLPISGYSLLWFLSYPSAGFSQRFIANPINIILLLLWQSLLSLAYIKIYSTIQAGSSSSKFSPALVALQNILFPTRPPDSRPYRRWLFLFLFLLGGNLALNLFPIFNTSPGSYQNKFFAVAVGLVALLLLRFSGERNSISNSLIVCIPFLIIVFTFVLSIDLDGDSWRTHFPKFNYISNAIADGHFFPPWFPSSGGIRVGVFHINFNQTLPHKLLGYYLFSILPISTVIAYKLQYVFGVILMCFGWWLVLKEITHCKYSAYLGTVMIMMGGTGITFHQEHVLATTYVIPWFVLSLLKLRKNTAYIFPVTILFGLGLSTHYPQIQIISMGLFTLLMIILRPDLIPKIFREQKRFIPVLVILLILALLPAFYVYKNSDLLASEERQAYETFRSKTYEDYLHLHRKTFSAAPNYFLQYIAPCWSKSPSDPYPIDLRDRCSFFVGRIGLILAGVGILLAFRKAWPIFILLIIFAALTLGMYSPVPIPKYLFLLRFPFIDVFRQWVHFFPMINFCLSVLAALGLERLIHYCRHRYNKFLGVFIMLIIFFQTVDLTIYDKKYLSLLWEKTRAADMFSDFFREVTTETGVFKYKNRLQLDHSCGKVGIPTASFLTTNITNLTGGSGQDLEKICQVLSDGNNSAATEIPPLILGRFFTPGKQLIRKEINSFPQYDGLFISFSAPSSALLVTPLNFDLGAKAYLDEREVEVWRVNSALSGILIPAGHHRVKFRIPFDLYLPIIWIQWILYGMVTLFLVISLCGKKQEDK